MDKFLYLLIVGVLTWLGLNVLVVVFAWVRAVFREQKEQMVREHIMWIELPHFHIYTDLSHAENYQRFADHLEEHFPQLDPMDKTWIINHWIENDYPEHLAAQLQKDLEEIDTY